MVARTTGLWAPIIRSQRAEWVFWPCVRATRRESRAEYLRGVPLEKHNEYLERVRFARVDITEAVPNDRVEGRD